MFDQLKDTRPGALWTMMIAVAIVVLPTIGSGTIEIALEGMFPSLGNRFEWFTLAPTYCVPALLGSCIGYFHAKKQEHPARVLYFVWLLPVFLMVTDFLLPGGSSLKNTLQIYFVPGYEYDEGLSRILFVSPTIGAAGYALTRYFASKCSSIRSAETLPSERQ